MNKTLPIHNTAQQMAARQRDISVSEFFLKNRHLLGFDSPAKAILITIKEAVDNALDACEDAGILPEIWVEISYQVGDVYRIAVEDNGPGILEAQLARIFGKLLYGSKFHKLSQSRGQQGIGISAAGMYAQLTTGKPLHVISQVQGESMATELLVSIDTTKNRPELHKKTKLNWHRPHGTRVEAQIEGHYPKGAHSIEMYLKQTAIANPHVTFHFKNLHGEQLIFQRSRCEIPVSPVEIKPHPHGIELGRLIQMLNNTDCHSLLQFLENEFSRVGRKTAQAIIQQANESLSERSYPKRIAHAQASALYRSIKTVPVSVPRTDCLAPIGEQQLAEGMRKEIDADFYVVTTRPPAVYRGNPFQIEIGIAYGRPSRSELALDERGHIHQKKSHHHNKAESMVPTEEATQLLRFANRVPLLYGQAGCAISKAVTNTNWHTYGLAQNKGTLPSAPMIILVHVASVWVPFTSEAKEAIAAYDEIIKEIKLGLQECGRKLAVELHKKMRLKNEYNKRVHIEKYLPHIGIALQEILSLSDDQRKHTVAQLDDVFQQTRKI